MATLKVINGKIDLTGLSAKAQSQVLALIDKANNQTQAQKDKEFKRLEKESLKRSYKGLFNIFNLIKKEGSFKSIKGAKFQAVTVLGSMNFNEFVNQLQKLGGYSFETIYKFVDVYDLANDGDKVLISDKGAKINALIMDVKNEVLTIQQAIEQYIVLCGAPFRTNKDGAKICTVTKSTAKYLFSNFNELYIQFGCAENFSELHTELTKVEEVEEVEAQA